MSIQESKTLNVFNHDALFSKEHSYFLASRDQVPERRQTKYSSISVEESVMLSCHFDANNEAFKSLLNQPRKTFYVSPYLLLDADPKPEDFQSNRDSENLDANSSHTEYIVPELSEDSYDILDSSNTQQNISSHCLEPSISSYNATNLTCSQTIPFMPVDSVEIGQTLQDSQGEIDTSNTLQDQNECLERIGDISSNISFEAVDPLSLKEYLNNTKTFPKNKKVHWSVKLSLKKNNRKKKTSKISFQNKQLVKFEEHQDFQCDHCVKIFRKKRYLGPHMRIHFGVKPHVCSKCSKAFSAKTKLTRHMQIHLPTTAYQCSYCQKYLSDKTALNAHLLTHTGGQKYACGVCGKICSSKGNLNTHLRSHIQDKRYNCHLCNKSFVHKYDLQSHIRSHTGEKPYSCNVCNARFNTTSKLTRHMRSHLGDYRYECNNCNEKFVTLQQLNRHDEKHQKQGIAECLICNETFQHGSLLLNHMKTTHEMKTNDSKEKVMKSLQPIDSYNCAYCNTQLASKSRLLVHIKNHIDKTCRVCNRLFSTAASLKIHLAHHDERPKKCSTCKFKFETLDELLRHQKTHKKVVKKVEEFICHYCCRSFTHKNNLKIHIRVHTGEKPYCCKICCKFFAQTGQLKEHLKTMNHKLTADKQIKNS